MTPVYVYEQPVCRSGVLYGVLSDTNGPVGIEARASVLCMCMKSGL
jgi:hypothetical protein